MTFEIQYNTAVKVFSKLFVGVKPVIKGQTVPLAFATPYETTKAGEKRQQTVRDWVGTRTSVFDPEKRTWVEHKYEPDLRIIENEPVEGFRITDDVKRVYWGGGNVVWRVLDPRGWELEIQSNNLMALIQSVGIQPDGVVPGKCVWGRDGAHNILLPIDTEEYKNSIKSAENIKEPKKIGAANRVIGRMYRLRDGGFARFIGKVFAVDFESDSTQYREHPRRAKVEANGDTYYIETHITGTRLVSNDVAYEAVLIPEDRTYEAYGSVAKSKLVLYKTAPLISELDDTTWTPEYALEQANLSPSKTYVTGKYCQIALVDRVPVKAEFGTVPVSREVFENALKETIADGPSRMNIGRLAAHLSERRYVIKVGDGFYGQCHGFRFLYNDHCDPGFEATIRGSSFEYMHPKHFGTLTAHVPHFSVPTAARTIVFKAFDTVEAFTTAATEMYEAGLIAAIVPMKKEQQ